MNTNIIRKSVTAQGSGYYAVHLSIISGLLPVKLTQKEIEVLAEFMNLDEKIVEDGRFNSVARKKVRESLNLSPGGLGNYLKSLLEKGYLVKSDVTRKISVRDWLVPARDAQLYQFVLQNK